MKPSLLVRILLSIAITALILFAVFLAGAAWLRGYLQSEEFAAECAAGIYDAIGVEGTMTPFTWRGGALVSEGFTGRGAIDSGIEAVRAERIRGRVRTSACLQRTWHIESVTVERIDIRGEGELSVRRHRLPRLLAAGPAWTATDEWPVRVDGVSIDSLNVVWAGGSDPVLVSGLAVRAAPEGDSWRARGERGRLRHGGPLPADIRSVEMRYGEDRVDLLSLDLAYSQTATVQATGALLLREDSRPLNARVELKRIPIAWWVPEDVGQHLRGEVISHLLITGDFDLEDRWELSGTWSVINGELRDLPVLNQIATVMREPSYRALPMQTARGELAWKGDTWRFDNIVLESEGWLRLNGQVVAEGDRFEGNFDMGVPPDRLKWIPGARGRVFTEARDGHRWTAVRIWGSGDEINEDLSDRLVQAAKAEITENAEELLEEGIERASELLRDLF